MYATDSLVDAAYLNSLGHQIASTRPTGDKCVFEFALSPSEATDLLSHPDRLLCARYQRSLRHVRKLIDVSLYGVGHRL